MQCKDVDGNKVEEYASHFWIVALVAAVYSLGVPLLFWYLVYRFKNMGQHGDPIVQKALGWMCEYLQHCCTFV